jgi:hypothetical protein
MSNFCQQGDITKIFIVDTGNTGSTGTDIYVTGGTYFGGTLTLRRNDGVIVPITGFSTTSIFTGNTSANCISDLYISNLHGCSPITVWDPINSLSSISATTYYGDGSNLTGIPNYYVTGGTFSNNTLILNRQNGSVPITGFTDYFVTGGTYSNGALTLNRQNGSLIVTGFLTGTTTDTFVTGFTFSSNTLTIGQNQGQAPLTATITTIDLSNIFSAVTFNIGTTGSISASTFYGSGAGLTGIPDYYVTGGTYSNGTLTLNRQNGSVSIYGLLSADTYVTGFTFNTGTYDLTIFQNNGVAPLIQNLGILAGDITVTGGTYNPNNGVATFYNNVGGSFQVPGFLTGFTDIYLSNGTYNPNTGNLTLTRTDNVSVIVTGFTDYYVTGGTYSSGTGTLTLNRQNGSVTISGFSTGGGTLSGDTYVTGFTYNNANLLTISQNGGQPSLNVFVDTFTGLTINGSISATTYYGNGQYLTGIVSTDNFVTGGTYTPSTGSLTLNRQNGSLSVTGFSDNFVTGGTFNTSNRVLTLNRQNGGFNVSGFTDTFVTGFTYSNNNLTITRSQGQTPLTVNVSIMTGLTINGGLTSTTLTVTSTSNLNGTITSTSLAGITDRIIQVNTGGTFSATNNIISAYITSGGTAANILENTNNWDINGNFIGSGVTGTYQGQKHYNNNYFFEAVVDNLFIRLIRG